MTIPKEVKEAIACLEKAKFKAFIVGGCVRDISRNIEPKDWDLTTNAKPVEIEKVFKKAGLKTVYENDFGTVAVITKSKNPTLKTLEITPYRTEAKYSDKRHPDKISWAKTIEKDLKRRDFTVNALAAKINKKLEIIDPFKGQEDLKNKVIKAVGKAEDRFNEDALRMMRAVRFAVSLEPDAVWQIEEKTYKAIAKNAKLIEHISQERIRDELVKIIMSAKAARGIELLRRLGLLRYIIPELEQGVGIAQAKHHIYQVYQHNLLSLNYACQNNFSKYVRIASLLHDVGKPKTKQGKGEQAIFHNHELVGARMTEKILKRLKFSKKDVEKITKLVRFHLFYYHPDEVGASSVRKLLRQLGQENIEELLQVRYADRIGSSVAKAEPYKLRHLKYMLEKVAKDPISAKMLKFNGNDIMKMLNVPPSQKVGHILSYLLSQVLSDPKNNVRGILEKEVGKLGKLSDQEIEKAGYKAQKEINTVKMKQDKMTKAKYWVS